MRVNVRFFIQVLFDMRQEVSELKKMVHNLMAEKGSVPIVTPTPPSTMPTIIHTVKAPCPVDDDIQDTEEYVEGVSFFG